MLGMLETLGIEALRPRRYVAVDISVDYLRAALQGTVQCPADVAACAAQLLAGGFDVGARSLSCVCAASRAVGPTGVVEDLADAIGQPADDDGCLGCILEQGWRHTRAIHMRGQACVLLGASDRADHGAGQVVQLLALTIGNGDFLDVEVGKDPLQFVSGACPPGGQALVEVAACKERAQPWMRQGRHAGELNGREVRRLIHQNLVAVIPQDGLERRPGRTVDIALDVGLADQVACGA